MLRFVRFASSVIAAGLVRVRESVVISTKPHGWGMTFEETKKTINLDPVEVMGWGGILRHPRGTFRQNCAPCQDVKRRTGCQRNVGRCPLFHRGFSLKQKTTCSKRRKRHVRLCMCHPVRGHTATNQTHTQKKPLPFKGVTFQSVLSPSGHLFALLKFATKTT